MKINNQNIFGGSQQFADKIINNDPKFSLVDRKIIEFIHANTNSEEERSALLVHLKTINNSVADNDQKSKSGGLIKNFLESGSSELGKQIIKELIENGVEYARYLI